MTHEPISGPSAWYGRDLARQRDWLRHFTAAEIAEIESAIRAFETSGVPLLDISPTSFPLPTLGPILRDTLAELLHGRGLVMLRGLPLDRWSNAQHATAYLGIGSWFGALRSQNARGHLLGHVKDVGLKMDDPKARLYQTNLRLDFHCDSADVVALLCLKTSKSGGESYVVSSMTLYNEVLKRRPDLVLALFEPLPTDRRGEVPEGMKPWFDIPIYHRLAGELTCYYGRQYIDTTQTLFPEAPRLTPAQVAVMDLLDALCLDPAIHLSMDFQPGDVQILHNHQILHARGAYEDWPEPERRRHLLRLWIAPYDARPLPDVFAPKYGSVVPGKRGGIVIKETRLRVAVDAE